MRLRRRQFLQLAAGAALPNVVQIARAEAYPTRPVRIVVGFAAGGGADIAARLIGQRLSDRLDQSFVIENRPGAGSNIGTEAVLNAPADGYSLLLATLSNAVNTTLYEKLNYNFIRDIAPVAGIIRVPHVILLTPSFPAKTVPDFIGYAKANPGKINMASGGNGSSGHMAGELFSVMAGLKMAHIPYRGQGPAFSDLLGGQVQVLFATTPGTTDYIKTGRLRALAVTTASRAEVLPPMGGVSQWSVTYAESGWRVAAGNTIPPPHRDARNLRLATTRLILGAAIVSMVRRTAHWRTAV
jgi:tripartite-type tricarboxylate transporter receptor subunit TctC